jgi:hypothetical protein
MRFTTPFFRTQISSVGQNSFSAKNLAGETATWRVDAMECPNCHKATLYLAELVFPNKTKRTMIFPRNTVRPAPPVEVPTHLAEDYTEASLVVDDSPKASAALSRRCLQALLRDQGFNQKDLAPAIDAILAAKILPASLALSIDAIRNVGNFAAHPMKDTNSGEILPVEDHEAEWTLDVLDGLFEFYYIAPARDLQRIAAMNAKLQAAGKPLILPRHFRTQSIA